MTISAVDASTSQNMELTAMTSKVMDKDDFLNLLITQLQNQDPLNPTDSTEFTAQLAQFSSLEQLNNVNQNLQTLQLYQASINNAQTVSFIGKEVTAEKMMAQYPDRLVQSAVKGMLPKGALGRQMAKKLKIYAGSAHPHQAQNPQQLAIPGAVRKH